nr:ribosomal protein L22 [Utricularia graminifolia]
MIFNFFRNKEEPVKFTPRRPTLLLKKIKLTKKEKKEKEKEVEVSSPQISISADKARRVIDQIRGRSYEETLMILEFMPYRACYPVLKLVCSAASNARNTLGSNEVNLIISKAEVNKGRTLKKFKPQAKGGSSTIRKPSCQITIRMKDISLDEYKERYPLKLK